MRHTLFVLVVLAGCTSNPANPGQPLFGGFDAAETAAYTARRAEVELFVKSNHPALIGQIGNGGGPLVDQAMAIAGVPASERPARAIQMQGDLSVYANSPGALVNALMVYSSS